MIKKYITLAMVIVFSHSTLANKQKGFVEPNIDTQKSFVKWTGYGVGKSLWGHVGLLKTDIDFEKQNPTKGEVVVDLSTIETKDLKDPEWAAKLAGHLKGEDFFDVAKHPTAKFVAKKITKTSDNAYKVQGDLTIKDKTKAQEVLFNLQKEGASKVLIGKLNIDRTDFDVKYNSKKFFSVENLKDKVIEDKIDLEINLALQP